MPTLNWIGKDAVVNHDKEVPFRLLRKVKSASVGDNSQNLIIHGDNLEALKALMPYYGGKVKCIYIDPPYNTGNEEWVYNDKVNSPKIKKWLGKVVGRESEDLCRHDKWLCMMYPRLRMLKDLLTEDGAVIISLGHQEISNLILICKEIFADKQVVCVTVQTSGGKPSGGFNYQHEYLVFIVPNELEPNALLYSGGQERSPYEGLTLATFTKVQRPNQAYPIFVNVKDGSFAGTGKSLQERIKDGSYKGPLDDFYYDYSEAPSGTIAVWPMTSKGTECVWRLIPVRLKSDWDKGYIKITKNKSKNAKNKYSIQYLPSGVIEKIETGKLEVKGTLNGHPTLEFGENKTVGGQIPTIWLEKSFYTVKGTGLLGDLFNKKVFHYPKPLDLVAEALRAISSGDDIILDSFAGSGTTGQAVMQLNKEDGKNRKFILVEMEDEVAKTVTAERIRRAIKEHNYNDGFEYCELSKPLFNEEGHIEEECDFNQFATYIYFIETQTNIDPKAIDGNYIGEKVGTEYYLIYKEKGKNVLDKSFLKKVRESDARKIVYADFCELDEKILEDLGIVFRQIPYEVKVY